ncbi:hypothetical protein PB2503_10959 [Parvularcula bermudensis HTCC2503]|uniref:Tyrosine-protein phosphatase domain-containing protein n=1 Tax=Parvularcula bermudensis (strain ATCC BAA-594 / HTCC2503 / KCTC 12087) TaxID=314260 RepID=E0THU6_PARBH|nr:protein-tyrosine phosphatase family protein [Parvularcula bermudensis]ADM10239.1 hypothetical protein PB2503_10959 [Parvularcula bermudensis HTCC2503]
MRIHVCSLEKAPPLSEEIRPGCAVSLLSPEDAFPTLSAQNHHRVSMHDISEVLPDHQPPMHHHVERLVAFLEDWDPSTPLLIHCYAGISRSTASAFTAACLKNPDTEETHIADHLRSASSTAHPNRRIVQFADDVLGREGRMVAAIQGIGRGVVAEVAQPFSIPARFPARP